MIDIHTHILPGLDDGAQEMSDSLDLAREASKNGISTIVATPHIGWPTMIPPGRIVEMVGILRENLAAQALPLEILPGGELQLEPGMALEFRAGRATPIGNGPYVLIELPMWNYPNYAEQTIFDLQHAGNHPEIAHPERCAAFEKDVALLVKLVQRGVLTQLTASSLLGGFGPSIKTLSEMMLMNNLTHVIASDCHGINQRPPILQRAVERAAQLIGNSAAEAMVTTIPEAIIKGKPITTPEPVAPKPRKRWGLF
jgi:protein-tyrosine phosphatase